jgi:hypothetical protein
MEERQNSWSQFPWRRRGPYIGPPQKIDDVTDHLPQSLWPLGAGVYDPKLRSRDKNIFSGLIIGALHHLEKRDGQSLRTWGPESPV